MDENPGIELLLSQETLKMSELAEFWIGIKLTNQSNMPITFDVSALGLLVNGERSISWDLAVQNGTIINLILEPLHAEIIRWHLGDALFTNSGKYELKLVSADLNSVKKTVTIYD